MVSEFAQAFGESLSSAVSSTSRYMCSLGSDIMQKSTLFQAASKILVKYDYFYQTKLNFNATSKKDQRMELN
jgi:hypothetical protein